jgi:hypothetical protein
MLAILVLIRDALIATALAWVGVTMEARVTADNACAGDACQTERAH